MIELLDWEIVNIDSELYRGEAIKLYLYDDYTEMRYNKYYRNKEDFRRYMLDNNVKFDKNKMSKK